MLSTLTRSIVAAGEMLQQLACTALLGSPAVTLLEDRLPQIAIEAAPDSHPPSPTSVH